MFYENNGRAYEVVPHTWIIAEDQVYYPKSFTRGKIDNAVEKCLKPEPKSSFKRWKMRILLETGAFCKLRVI